MGHILDSDHGCFLESNKLKNIKEVRYSINLKYISKSKRLGPNFTPPLRLERIHYVFRYRFDWELISNEITHLLSLFVSRYATRAAAPLAASRKGPNNNSCLSGPDSLQPDSLQPAGLHQWQGQIRRISCFKSFGSSFSTLNLNYLSQSEEVEISLGLKRFSFFPLTNMQKKIQ